MKPMLVLLFAALLVAGSASIASAQLTSAKEGPVVYGHHHLNTTNMDAQKKFFVDTLGGTLIKVGTNNAEIVKFPNVLIFFRATQAPTGGTRGTTRTWRDSAIVGSARSAASESRAGHRAHRPGGSGARRPGVGR